ncbi:MAG TPA: mRNA interferase [Oceanospirillaceae bacterium]|nr:mRNA interferase [Oceanospirillaceae bacterium]
MKCNEFKRWLITRGVVIVAGKKHDKCYYLDRQCTLPRHGSKEIGEGLRLTIIKQLNLK